MYDIYSVRALTCQMYAANYLKINQIYDNFTEIDQQTTDFIQEILDKNRK
jgi:hypothetical protein